MGQHEFFRRAFGGFKPGRHAEWPSALGGPDERGAGGQLHPAKYFRPGRILGCDNAAGDVDANLREPGRAVESGYATAVVAGEAGGKAAAAQHLDAIGCGNRPHRGIGGFIVTGTEAKKVILRAIGPSLGASGLANVLSNPVLELHGGAGDNLIATNDNWQDDAGSGAELAAAGMAPTNPYEAAIVVTLPPGQYTAVIDGKDGATGTALVEIYDGELTANSQLANISTLGFVGAADDVLIGGFVIGNGAAKVVLRALGPTLTQFGVANPIGDPTVELHDANGGVTTNDDWQTGADRDSIPVSLQPVDLRESAIYATLSPGSYTAIVRGKAGATGVALVEVYNLP